LMGVIEGSWCCGWINRYKPVLFLNARFRLRVFRVATSVLSGHFST
jgi:hypothetical protein